MRAAARVVSWLLLLLVCLFVPVGAASADAAPQVGAATPALPGTDCLRPPTPASPNSGVSAWLDPGPENPREGDPFDPNSGVSLYDVYGYAGTSLVIYDPGCLNSSRLFDENNMWANAGISIANVTTAATAWMTRTVTSGTFGAIWDPVQEQARKVTGDGIYLPLAGVAVAAAGLYVAWRGRKGDLAGNASLTGSITGIAVIGAVSAVYALTIGGATDRMMSESFDAFGSVASSASGQDRPAAETIAATTTRNVSYRMWVLASFGGDEKAATEYGPRLFREGAFTRAEQAEIDANPSTAQERIDQKKNRYKAVASELKQKYPQAYEAFAGNDTSSRVGFGVAAAVAGLAAGYFLILCLVRLVVGMVAVRVGIGAAPLVATVAILPPFESMMWRLIGWAARSVVAAVIYGALFWLYLLGAVVGIMGADNGLHPMVKAAALILTGVIMQVMVRATGVTRLGWEPRFGGRHRAERDRGWSGQPEPDQAGPTAAGVAAGGAAGAARGAARTVRAGRSVTRAAAPRAALAATPAAPAAVAATAATIGAVAVTSTTRHARDLVAGEQKPALPGGTTRAALTGTVVSHNGSTQPGLYRPALPAGTTRSAPTRYTPRVGVLLPAPHAGVNRSIPALTTRRVTARPVTTKPASLYRAPSVRSTR